MRVIRDIFLLFYDDHVTNERERKRERERERLKCTLSSSFLIHHLNTILHFAKYYISIPFFTRIISLGNIIERFGIPKTPI